MRSPTSAVLSAPEFPRAELDALRLDGEAFPLDDCAVAIDEVPGVWLRAAVLCSEIPPRLIAEQHSAAWVWGAAPRPPARHELCASSTARTRPAPGARLAVREVVLDDEDVTSIGGLQLTTPLRTAIDLARCVLRWSDAESRVVAALMHSDHFDVDDCLAVMNRRKNLPNKREALLRLRTAATEELSRS